MNGAETTAGSIFSRCRISGSTAATAAAQTTMNSAVTATTGPISGPTPSIQARA